MNYSNERIKTILKKYSRLFPEPDLIFLIDIPEDIAYERKMDTPSIDYLFERRGLYLAVAREHKMMILDGSKDILELQEKIEKELQNTLR